MEWLEDQGAAVHAIRTLDFMMEETEDFQAESNSQFLLWKEHPCHRAVQERREGVTLQAEARL